MLLPPSRLLFQPRWRWLDLRLRLRQMNLALLVVHNLPDLRTPQMVLSPAQRAVVVEQVPLALELCNAMVRRPAHHRL